MNIIKHTALIIVLLMLVSCHSPEQKSESLSFKNWSYPGLFYSNISVTIDSLEFINNKYPICLTQCFDLRINPQNLLAYAEKIVELPESYSDCEIKIKLHSKCLNLSHAAIRVTCLDKDEKIVGIDSMDINSNYWQEKELIIPASKVDGVKLIYISITGEGGRTKDDIIIMDSLSLYKQALYLDTIDLYVGHQHLYKLKTDKKKPKAGLNPSTIIPVGKKTDIAHVLAPFVKEKSIIGLGETMHGSECINSLWIDIVKAEVAKGSCNLVAVEIPFSLGLYCNLFVQGILAEEDIENILAEIEEALISEKLFSDLLFFLRQHNLQAKEKVRLFGFDKDFLGGFSYEDILVSMVNKENAKKLLPVIWFINQTYFDYEYFVPNIKNHAEILEECIGKEYTSLIIHGLISEVTTRYYTFTPGMEREAYNINVWRDECMWKNLKLLLDIYQKPTHSVILTAHYGHLNKLNICGNLKPSLGYYISKQFNSQYFFIGLTAGEGKRNLYLPNEGGISDRELTAPIDYSFEQLGMQTGLDHFYCPTNQLPAETRYLRHEGSMKSDLFSYQNLSCRTDGMFFIKKSLPLFKKEIKKTDATQNRQSIAMDKRQEKFNMLMKEYKIEKKNYGRIELLLQNSK